MTTMSSSNGNGATNSEQEATPGRLAQWKKKMITKEDPLHVHKSIGIACLISYIFRLVQYGESDMGFKARPEWTVPTILLHLLLNLSSFEFHIPPKRIESGYRIWPEYRFHSLVFLCRSLAIMGLNWYELHFELDPNYAANVVIVLATMAAADIGSLSFGSKYQSGFARELDVPNYVRYFFSVMQFYATSGCLFGLRRNSIYFIFVIIIQGNAFLMTVRRKNLASHYGLIAVYGAALAIGWLVGRYEVKLVGEVARRLVVISANLVAIVRLGPLPSWLGFLQNKYLLWICAAYFVHKLRPLEQMDDAPLTIEQLRLLHYASMAGMLALGWYNCAYGYEKRAKSRIEKTASKKD